jgi:fatty acid desaturase
MCAYIAHDVAHGQASRSRAALDTLFPILSAAQGLSLTWWKRKHSLHHAQTNVYKLDGGAPACVDGDIDTLPLFCWSDKLLTDKQKKSALYRTWLRAQRFTIWAFFPILRMQWVWHSLRHGKNSERALIALHHAALLAVASWISPSGLEGALVLLFGANAIAGSLLASFFLFGHSGMHVRESTERLDEFREQVRATRNFSANPFAAWLTGGLNYQIEHHLFPTLPRGRLGKVAPRVAALAKKHGEDYQSDTIFKAYARVFRSLDMKI